jgi:hypothetical protein
LFIGKKDEKGNIYYTFKDIPKIHKLSTFFRYGFYIALIIWMCGICFSMFYNGSSVIKVTVITISLCIYIFFAIEKSIMESKFGR